MKLTIDTDNLTETQTNGLKELGLLTEPSRHFTPKKGEKYWEMYGDSVDQYTNNSDFDQSTIAQGLAYPTKEACEHAYKVRCAENTIRRSTEFAPDWDDKYQIKYYVYYDHRNNRFVISNKSHVQEISAIYFASEEEAQASLDKFPEEWKLYANVAGGEINARTKEKIK
jgi:hypothetical protein